MKNKVFSIMEIDKRKAFVAIFCAVLLAIIGMGLIACSNTLPVNGSENLEPRMEVGDIIQLGGSDWRILNEKGGKTLVLSDKVLLKREYHSSRAQVTWEECDLRQYLNKEFFDSTFSPEEKKLIVETKVKNNNNPWYGNEINNGKAGGKDTKDKVFLLSLEEVVQYFGDNGELWNKPEGAIYINDGFNEGRIAQTLDGKDWRWWLRSPGFWYFACGVWHINASCVLTSGYLGVYGDYMDSESCGVRPAMWLNTTKTKRALATGT